ncbi:hypothetical protein GCM10011390_40150 [Aureimonas endophytica]|uniref:Antitoxin n=1 Tax=Aureimonas endophytica TaxID=2027858 RepID=A0A916ZWL3_9HYPH|nr:type II toxin-antitoxin system prevent-host-death family antitoxin [Aureimonas endophytica]GGE17014.1 hypothetical protein GCM10011390_40150 [Aureimonas endophytica]
MPAKTTRDDAQARGRVSRPPVGEALPIMTSQEFNQNPSAAKRAAAERELIVTEHGRNRFVLMSYERYERLTAGEPAAGKAPKRTLADLADMRPEADFDFEFERFSNFGREIEL